MSGWKKLASAAAASGAALNVEDVFSTYLYEGNATVRSITNGIDLAGEGGLTWIKRRITSAHVLFDTERGATKRLVTNNTNAESTATDELTSFNSDGFSLGTGANVNGNGNAVASWTFRKAPKFFDVVTYTGDGVQGRTVSHDLGSAPGCVIVKKTSSTGNWPVYHRGMTSALYGMQLNSTNDEFDADSYWDSTDPTASVFTLGNNADVNQSGATYVAYLFAHNDGDGEFGPTGDQDIIKCGSFTTDGSGVATVDLGWEPQFILTKNVSGTGYWLMFDNMRGLVTGVSNGDKYLAPNTNGAEVGATQIDLSATGFETASGNWATNADHFYIAIRRGPMAVPESATDVFAMDTFGGTSPNPPEFVSGFPVDLGVYKVTNTTGDWVATPRLTQGKRLRFNRDSTEDNETSAQFDYMNGYYDGTSVLSQYQGWMWRRAPSFFDVVAYTGTGSNQTIDHNLGIAPEMMWVKARSRTGQWIYYHSAIGNTGAMWINDIGDGVITDSTYWNNTSPSSTNFSLGNNYRVNQSGEDYIAYLFASVDGVSKVGSYTGDGTNGRTIDCGFSSGARFVLIKDTAANTPFQVYDSERGIVSGNDPLLQLNSTAAEVTSFDFLDPDSSGFQVNSTINYVNQSGRTYIFYAIA